MNKYNFFLLQKGQNSLRLKSLKDGLQTSPFQKKMVFGPGSALKPSKAFIQKFYRNYSKTQKAYSYSLDERVIGPITQKTLRPLGSHRFIVWRLRTNLCSSPEKLIGKTFPFRVNLAPYFFQTLKTNLSGLNSLDLPFFNRSFDKKRLKNLFSWYYSNKGEAAAFSLIERVQKLGFHYAMKAGISLGVDDLKVPLTKGESLTAAVESLNSTKASVNSGNVTALEEFQQFVDIWHRTSETLKTSVIQNFTRNNPETVFTKPSASRQKINRFEVKRKTFDRQMEGTNTQALWTDLWKLKANPSEPGVQKTNSLNPTVSTSFRSIPSASLHQVADKSTILEERTVTTPRLEENREKDYLTPKSVILALKLKTNKAKNTDRSYGNPLNPVYMMAFSGARGNLSQVRQLVGMRGLMADPQGQLVEFPIQSNFREGLTVTEYMISCYGARKGLIDTALRTAAAGYLTRRLVDVSHHQIVRFVTCGTKNGILFPLSFKEKKASNPVTNLPSTWNVPLQNSSEKKDRGNLSRGKLNAKLTLCIGRVLARNIPGIAFRNQEIDISLASLPAMQKIYETVGIYVRSPLTCRAEKGICQLCYGWSVSANRLVGLGEAVGIIAAQSIGEPGTQLTMRTFHTGGVFSGDIMEECRAKHGGTVEFKTPYFGLMVRAAGGSIAFCIKTPGVLHIKTKDQISVYDLLPNSLLYVRQGEKVKAGSLLAQIPNLPEIEESSGEATKTIFSNFSGEVRQSRTFSTHLQNIKILASQKPPYMDFPTSTIFSSIYRAESFTGANSTLHSWQLEPSAPQANSENPFRYLRLAKEPGQNPGVLQAQSPLNPKFNPLASDLKGAFASVRLAEPRGAKTFRVNIIPGCHRFRQKPKGFQNINPKGFGANFVYSPVQIFDGGEKKGIGTGRSIKNLEGWDFSSPPNASIVKSNKVYSEKSKNSRLQTPDLKSGDGPKKLRYLTHFENSSPAGLKALEPFSSTENSFFLSLLRYRVCLNLSGNIYPKRLKRFRLLEEKTNKPDASFIKTSGLNKTFIKFLPNPKLYLPLYNSKYNQNSRLSQKLHGLNFYVKYYKKFQRSQSYVASPLTAKPLSKSLNFSLNSLALKKRNCYQPFSFFLSNLFYKVNRNKKKKLFVIFSTSLLENSFWWFGDQKLRLLGEQSSLEEVKKRVQRLQLDHGFCLRDGASLQEPNAPRVFGTPVKKLGLDQPESEIVFNPLDQTLNRVRERGENLQKLKRVEIKNYSYLFWKRSTLLFINSYNLPSRLTSKTYNKPLRFNLESGEFSRWFKGSEKKTRKKVEFDKSSKRRVLGPFTGALGPKVLYNAKTPLDPKHQVRFSSLRFKGANSQRTPQQAISKPTCAPARRSPLWRAASIRRKVNGLDQSFSQTFRVSPFLAERERFSRLPSLFPKIKKNPTARTFLTKKFFSQTAPFGFFQIFPNYQWYQKWRGIEPYNKTFVPLWRGEKTDFFPTKKNEKEKRFTFVYNFEPKVTGALEFFNLWLPSVAPFKPKTTTSLEKKTLTRDQTESLEISKFSLSPFNLSRLTFSTSARWPQKFLENCFSSSEDSFTKGFYLQPFWLLREDKGGYNFFTPSGFFNYKNLFSKVKSPRNTPIQKDGEIFPIQGNQKLQDFSQSYPSLPLSLKKTALLTYSDRVSYKTLFKKNQSSNFFRPGVGSFINIGDSLDENQNSAYCGQIIEKSFSSLTLRLTQNILYSNFPFRPARVNKELKKANWAAKGSSLVTLPYITSVTGDIVAGIPKIEQLFEARGEVLGETVEKIWSFYKSAFLSGAKAVRECYKEIGLFVVLSIQNVYLSQGVHIADKHLEVIIRQMTQRAVIIDPGDTSFLSDEFVDLHTIECVNWSTYGVRASYKPRLIGITKASLTSNSFLSSASFQQTARVLERETFLEKTDRLLGLKERVMIGAIINAGTGSLQTNVFLSKTNKKRSWKERGELSFFNKLDFFSRRKMNLFSKEGFYKTILLG